MNIILCGYHWSGCEALKQLLRNKHKVFVYTQTKIRQILWHSLQRARSCKISKPQNKSGTCFHFRKVCLWFLCLYRDSLFGLCLRSGSRNKERKSHSQI